jgi:hypothetical protein
MGAGGSSFRNFVLQSAPSGSFFEWPALQANITHKLIKFDEIDQATIQNISISNGAAYVQWVQTNGVVFTDVDGNAENYNALTATMKAGTFDSHAFLFSPNHVYFVRSNNGVMETIEMPRS